MKVKNLIPVCAYSASALLIAFYVFTLIGALTPDVSYPYSLYYITKEIDFWPGNDAYQYILGTSEPLSLASKRLGEGWNKDETGCRTIGEGSYLYFEGLPLKPLELVLKCGEAEADIRVTVKINDVNSFSYLLKQGEDTILLKLPNLDVENWKLVISFVTDSDEEQMSVLIKEVQINEIKD